jgi:hypothetical protein
MEYSDVELENICQEKLGWTEQKVARTRPAEMRAAIIEFDEDINSKTIVSSLSNEAKTFEMETEILAPCVKKETPEVLFFSRSKRCNDQQSVQPFSNPLLTPMPTMRPVMVTLPSRHSNRITTAQILVSGSKSDIEKSINQLVSRHVKLSKQLQEKKDLTIELKDEMDLEETLVLETSITYTSKRLQRTTYSILNMKTQIEQSIDRKKKLLAVATQSDDDNDDDKDYHQQEDESEKGTRLEHMERVASILEKIDALESVLYLLNV